MWATHSSQNLPFAVYCVYSRKPAVQTVRDRFDHPDHFYPCQNGQYRFEPKFPNFSTIQTDLNWFRPFWHVQKGRPLCHYDLRDRFNLPDRFGQILNYDVTRKMTKPSTFSRYIRVYLDRFGRRICTSVFRTIWPTDLDKYIHTDLADWFGPVYSERFDRRIWTSIVRPMWPTDWKKCIQTDLTHGFGQVYSDGYCWRI